MPIWLNGLVDEAEARVSVLDRGFLFGDGVYELVRYFNGVGLQMGDHVARLARSLRALDIEGFDATSMPAVCEALLSANGLRDASVYLQVTRGAGRTRAHLPEPGLKPLVMAMATPMPTLQAFLRPEPARAVLLEDIRWHRCDIKSIALVGNIVGVMDAARRGADEAIFHRHGQVAEGASTNVFAVLDGTLVTPPVTTDPPILHGVTRLLAFEAANILGVPVEQRALPVDELRRASEAMITSSRRIVSPLTHLDGAPVGDGRPGPVATALFAAARRAIARECGVSLDEDREAPAALLGGAAR